MIDALIIIISCTLNLLVQDTFGDNTFALHWFIGALTGLIISHTP